MPVHQGFKNLKFLLQFIRLYNEAGDTTIVRESKNFGKIRNSNEVKLTCMHTHALYPLSLNTFVQSLLVIMPFLAE